MVEAVPKRRLAAIVSADVVGYSRLMGADEAGTLARLKAHRQELIDPVIEKHDGRVVKLMGDGILIEFSSAVEAVSCAVEVQRAMADRNESIPEAQRIVFRVGINLGDIIIEGEDIYGDGVNIAARLEALAEPGSVYISEDIYRQVQGKLDYNFDDLGAHQFKNIIQPVRVYRVGLQAESNTTAAAPGVVPRRQKRYVLPAAFALLIGIVVLSLGLWPPWQAWDHANPGRRSIAVLPFTNMSDNPDQEYFADGLTEDLITDMSKLSGLLVIARNLIFAYKNQSVSLQQAAEELGVRYLLEGSVRKAGGKIRINVQLIDSASGGHLWAERYDRQLTDIFELQDEVIERIVAALAVQITDQEEQQLAQRATQNAEAYDYFLRGQAFLRTTAYEQARAMYQNAIAIDRGFARAYGALATSYSLAVNYGLGRDPEGDLAKALALGNQAKTMNDSIPQVRWALGSAYLMNRQYDQALFEARQTIALDPGYADGYGLLAWIHNAIGKPEEAIGFIEQAMRFNPNLNAGSLSVLGRSYLLAGRLEKAIETLQASRDRNPELSTARIFLTIAYMQARQTDEAEWEAEELLAMYPDFSVERWGQTQPYKDQAQRKRMMDDLRQAGLPK